MHHSLKWKLSGLMFISVLLVSCAHQKHYFIAVEHYPNSDVEEVVVTSNKGKKHKYRYHTSHTNRFAISSMQLPQQDRSEYPEYKENNIKLVRQDPVSTFSIDTDTSSYSLMRASLNRGVMPTAQMIRTEELINYFNYDYPLPESKEQPFAPDVSLIDAPWSAHKQLLRIGIKGFDVEQQSQPDSNLVFLLDVSGSMQAVNKLPLLKKSIKLLLKRLKPNDTVSMVVYAGASGVVLEPTKVSEKRKIISALDRLSAGGSTAGGAGLQLAYDLAKESYKEGAVNRIILGTDGDFNVGASRNGDILELIKERRKQGVYLSVFGFGGYNYQDDMMQTIAQNGNGIAAYIDTLHEAKKVFVDEATSNLFPIANDVKIQIEFNPSVVSEYRLLGYETRQLKREDFNNDKVDAGEVGAGHSVTAIYEITKVDAQKSSVDPLRYQKDDNEQSNQQQTLDEQYANELAFLKIRYKLPGSSESKLISKAIKVNLARSNDAGFAAAVAGFAELLRSSVHTQNWGYDDVVRLAKENRGQDLHGYRAEFIKLVELTQLMEDKVASR